MRFLPVRAPSVAQRSRPVASPEGVPALSPDRPRGGAGGTYRHVAFAPGDGDRGGGKIGRQGRLAGSHLVLQVHVLLVEALDRHGAPALRYGSHLAVLGQSRGQVSVGVELDDEVRLRGQDAGEPYRDLDAHARPGAKLGSGADRWV